MNKQLTFNQLLIASLILKKKINQYEDEFIGVMLPTSSGTILTVIATLMAGKVPVMINYSGGAADTIKYAQKKCSFSTVITSKKFLEKLNCPIVEGMVFIEDILESVTSVDKIKALLISRFPVATIKSKVHNGSMDEDAVILFTSGSEKDPKAVELTHKNISSNIDDICDAISLHEDDRFLGILPFFHVFGLTANLWIPMVKGKTVITWANPLEFRSVVKTIREKQPTILFSTPSFLMGYLKQSQPGDFRSLRTIITGADKTPDWLREKFLNLHDITLYEGYGTTETSPAISLNTPEGNKPGSIGRPLKNVSVKILDIDTDKELPRGEEGRIMIKGDHVMKGYYKDPEETSQRIRHGWYDTGDIGILDEDNFIWHRGRLKRFAKIGGEMVSLPMIEFHLAQELDEENRECCVVAIPDARKGSKVIAILTNQVDERELMARLVKSLPSIAVPKSFLIVEELPKFGNGKINFRQATELAVQLFNRNSA